VEDVEDEPLFAERVAGIDIGKAMVMATLRVPARAGGSRRRQETRQFGTTRRDLLALAAWLREWQVERAGMVVAHSGARVGVGRCLLHVP
jgi:transposase